MGARHASPTRISLSYDCHIILLGAVGQLGAEHDMVKAFDAALGSLDDGWRFECIALRVQSDGHNCGVWDLVGDRDFVAYLDSDEFGRGFFGSFFERWLKELGVSNLLGVRGRAETSANQAFVSAERDAMRMQLLTAARAEKLVYTDGPQIDAFTADGASEATDIDLDALDEAQ